MSLYARSEQDSDLPASSSADRAAISSNTVDRILITFGYLLYHAIGFGVMSVVPYYRLLFGITFLLYSRSLF
jgi:hypothetical protein